MSSIKAMAEYHKKGGKAGGPARALKLTPARRTEIASQAARARWAKRQAILTGADTEKREPGGST